MLRYTYCGKQVLHNDKPFADACDNVAAVNIAAAMNEYEGLHDDPIMPELREAAPGICQAYQTNDTMTCQCGLQWDVDENSPCMRV